MKPYCEMCAFLKKSDGVMGYYRACLRPEAKQFNRVSGYYSPTIESSFGPPNSELLAKCDKNKWFAPKPEKKPRWWGLCR